MMGTNRFTPLYRFLFLLVFSGVLLIVDHRSQLLAAVRTATSIINLPFERIIYFPAATRELVNSCFPENSWQQRYQALTEEQQILKARMQNYQALRAENARLSQLLSGTAAMESEVLLTKIVEIGLEPYLHRVVINRGRESDVYLGQPAITPDGVLGQVSSVGIKRSVVTLITDPSHGIPVYIQRNDLQAIVQGIGVAERVSVPSLPGQADIQRGDVLITSGLGDRFLPGYKVATVEEILTDANKAFLTVNATPFAKIGSIKEVLLLGRSEEADTPTPAAIDE